MTTVRAAWATVVMGTTMAGALWLFLHRETAVIEYLGYTFGVRHEFHEPVTVRDQPWWSVPGAVALIVVGVAVVLWLLPGWRTSLRRLVSRLGDPQHRVS